MPLTLHNANCMDILRDLPDNSFDLAVVDPPYGIGYAANPVRGSHTAKEWDSDIPSAEYFKQLRRVSKNQIIWGGNYFQLPPTQCFIFWHKKNPAPSMADGELAWTSFQRPAKYLPLQYFSSIEGNTKRSEPRIHPTQKPVALYHWIFQEFANPSHRILDTHLGSGSSAIAAYQFGSAEFVGIELDRDYFLAAKQRIELSMTQKMLFANG